MREGHLLSRLKTWARTLLRDLVVLGLAVGDPRVPWYAKVLAVVVVAYAASPIDLIPDVIPVIGYLDDLVLLPAGLWLTLRLIPPLVLDDLRRRATASDKSRCGGRVAAIVIVGLWLLLAVAVVVPLAKMAGFLPAH